MSRVQAARLGGILAVAWLVWGGGLWLAQDRLIFPAPGTDPAVLSQVAERVGVREVALQTADGLTLRGWHSAPEVPRSAPRAMLLLHGNGSDLRATGHLHRIYRDAGFEVLSVGYRGYPGSPGSPSQAGLVADARAGWTFLRRAGSPAHRIGIHGTSLGGGVGAQLAAEVEPGALVLQSTFTSMVAMARRRAPLHPVRTLLRHPFDTLAVAPQLTIPTLVVHSHDDDLIPVHHGQTLAAAVPGAQWLGLHGFVHNQAPLALSPPARTAVLAFLDDAVPPR